jgi:acid phosphatase (class A)
MRILSEKLRRIVAEELMAENLAAAGVLPDMTHLIPMIPQPQPGSPEEAMDLYSVIDQHHNNVVPESLQLSCDEDMVSLFEKLMLSKGLSINTSYYDKLKEELVPTIRNLKEYFGRPRPDETAKALGVEFVPDDLDSAKTPSYPSGHTIQAHVIGSLLIDLHPELNEELTGIADIISESRIDRGVHFPTDIAYGKIIGKILAQEILLSLDESKPEGLS